MCCVCAATLARRTWHHHLVYKNEGIAMTSPSPWSPEQYARFHAQRAQPFFDLLALIQPDGVDRMLDLGCGTGDLTAHAFAQLGCTEGLGVDASETMLARASDLPEGLRLEQRDITDVRADTHGGPWPLVLSNAALQWIEDHPSLFAHVLTLVAPGGQLAVQVPANHDHPSHVTSRALARDPEFAAPLGGYVRPTPVLEPEDYVRLLDRLGLVDIHVRLQVYPHHLPSRDAVVEWVKGSLLTAYQRRLDPETFARFVDVYTARLLAQLPDTRPFLYPFKRILMWGRRPA